MNRGRTIVVLVVILVWGFLTPIAMAASCCLAECEGPCSASSGVVSAMIPPDVVLVVTTAPPDSACAERQIEPTVLELPPK